MAVNDTATDEYSVIKPIASEVQFGERRVSIAPLKVGQIPPFARALKGIESKFFSAVLEGDYSCLPALLADHGEGLISAAAVGSGLPVEELNNADADQFLALVVAVVKVNADFFVQRLIPAMKDAVAQAQASSGAGQTASRP